MQSESKKSQSERLSQRPWYHPLKVQPFPLGIASNLTESRTSPVLPPRLLGPSGTSVWIMARHQSSTGANKPPAWTRRVRMDGRRGESARKKAMESEAGGVPTVLSFKLHCAGRAAPEAAGTQRPSISGGHAGVPGSNQINTSPSCHATATRRREAPPANPVPTLVNADE